MKYFFQNISWNTYLTMFHCVNYREMSMIYVLRHFMKYENSENRFSEFSLSWKTLLLNLFPCLINSFVINDVYKSLKENVSITWKQAKWFSYFILQNLKDTEDRLEQFFSKLWMKTILTILMQLQDFKCIKHRGSIKKASNLAKLDTVFW